jgi:plasmid stabilization system protein ParE
VKSLWSKRAKKDLDRITSYVSEHFSAELAEYIKSRLKETALHLEQFPELGRKIGGHFHKRYLIIDGNTVIYEIVLQKTPMVIIREIRTRKS